MNSSHRVGVLYPDIVYHLFFLLFSPLDTYYSPGPHEFFGEFEDLDSSWLRTIPGYTGYGYAIVLVGVRKIGRITTEYKHNKINI